MDEDILQIELQGFGYYIIKNDKYQSFIDITEIDSELFLDLIDIKNIEAIPILSINVSKIEKEGPIPYGFKPTEIGLKRLEKLINEKVIEKFLINNG